MPVERLRALAVGVLLLGAITPGQAGAWRQDLTSAPAPSSLDGGTNVAIDAAGDVAVAGYLGNVDTVVKLAGGTGAQV